MNLSSKLGLSVSILLLAACTSATTDDGRDESDFVGPHVMCTMEWLPVCGANGETYSNACRARAAGQQIVSEGACPEPAERSCGGHTATPSECGTSEFCDYTLGAMCGAADHPGTCRTKPTRCPRDVNEVCGCDGKTYTNACNAAARGVAVFANAPCR